MSGLLNNLYADGAQFLRHLKHYANPSRTHAGTILAISPAGSAFLKKLGVDISLQGDSDADLADAKPTANTSRVEASLLRLDTIENLLDFLEEGVQSGVLTVDSGRFQISVGMIGAGTSITADITSQLTRSSVALKSREAGPILNAVLQGQSNRDVVSTRFIRTNESQRDPDSISFGQPRPNDSFRSKIAEFLRSRDVSDSQDPVRASSLYRVIGADVILPEGTFVPVEAVSQTAQEHGAALKADAPNRLLLPKARVSDVDIDPIVNAGSKSATSSMPNAEQIELAWRLVRDMSEREVGGVQLEGSLRFKLESLLQTDLSHIRLETGPAAEYVTSVLGAEALTAAKTVIIPDRNISGGGGEPSATLVHELVHVKQYTENRLSSSREELESEARGTASAITEGASSFLLANKMNPIMSSVHAEPHDVFMEWSDYQDGHGHSQAQRRMSDAAMNPEKRPRLMSEGILEKLTDHFHSERKREKEEYKDRVF